MWVFAAVGRGTPGLWDAPRQVVAAGPYRWVRNPIYIAAVLIVCGEAWLFLSVALLAYAGALAVAFHLLVISYEEPRLLARFGEPYEAYLAWRTARGFTDTFEAMLTEPLVIRYYDEVFYSPGVAASSVVALATDA